MDCRYNVPFATYQEDVSLIFLLEGLNIAYDDFIINNLRVFFDFTKFFSPRVFNKFTLVNNII